MRSALLVCLCLVAGALASVEIDWNKGNGVAGPMEFIVTTFSEEGRDEVMKGLRNETSIMHTYRHVVYGFAAKLDKRDLKALVDHPAVKAISENAIYKAYQVPVCHTKSQEQPRSWGQTRVSQINSEFYSSAAHHDFRFDAQNEGEGVTVYVIDTGVFVEHEDFEGRATFGYKPDSTWSDTDVNGHGTHVAATIAGKLYGLAKKAKVIAVKVLGDDGSGSTAGIIAGLDWAAGDSLKRNACVANLSLGGIGKSLNDGVNSLAADYMAVCVAAGNDGLPAKFFSPASAKNPITVGALTEGQAEGLVDHGDQVASYSNVGPDVEIFAPGTSITSAWPPIDSQGQRCYPKDACYTTSAELTISGTSMASPHVAGVAAQMCSGKEQCRTARIKEVMFANAEEGDLPKSQLAFGNGDPAANRLLQSAYCQTYVDVM